jgi:hypothetical protein
MSGKAVAQPAIPLMKSRRRIAGSLPRYADDGFQRRDYSRDLRSAEWGSMINLRCKSLRHRCPLWVRSGHGAIKLRCPCNVGLSSGTGHSRRLRRATRMYPCVTLGRALAIYSAATCAASALSLGLISQASSQLSTLSDLTNLPTPSTSAQNKPSSMISSSEK